jgi:hypothetical protein
MPDLAKLVKALIHIYDESLRLGLHFKKLGIADSSHQSTVQLCIIKYDLDPSLTVSIEVATASELLHLFSNVCIYYQA